MPTTDGTAASNNSSLVGGSEIFGPLRVLVNLDPETEAGQLEGMEVVVRPADIVVTLRRPVAILQAEAGSKQGGLGLLRVARHEIEVTEAASAIRIAGT